MTAATQAERDTLRAMTVLAREARGDAPALADVRRQIAQAIDHLTGIMRAGGVDVDALLDEIDAELDSELEAAST